jgi:hypothetical protein
MMNRAPGETANTIEHDDVLSPLVAQSSVQRPFAGKAMRYRCNASDRVCPLGKAGGASC